MFKVAKSFDYPLDEWDISNVEDMENMFDEASAYTYGELEKQQVYMGLFKTLYQYYLQCLNYFDLNSIAKPKKIYTPNKSLDSIRENGNLAGIQQVSQPVDYIQMAKGLALKILVFHKKQNSHKSL